MFEYNYHAEIRTLVVSFGGNYIPRMTLEYLTELWLNTQAEVRRIKPAFVVFESRTKGYFNLGGDLSLFYDNLTNRSALKDYAELCINVVMLLQNGFNSDVHTFAVVDGECLGGGLEGALACDHIISGTKASYGLPEAKFGLFPGMGAYHLIKERSDEHVAFTLCSEGDIYQPQDMLAKGLIFKHTPDPMNATLDVIKRWHAKPAGWKHIMQVRRKTNVVNRELLDKTVNYWVKSVSTLSQKEVDRMRVIIKAQSILEKRLCK